MQPLKLNSGRQHRDWIELAEQGRYSAPMFRLALFAVAMALTGCQQEKPQRAYESTPPRPVLGGMVDLQAGDGRLYVIRTPDGMGQVSFCFLHVRDGASSMSCAAPVMDISSPAP